MEEDNQPETAEADQGEDALIEQGTVSKETKGMPLGHFLDVGMGWMF